MSCRRWKDYQVTDPLVVGIDWEVCLEHLVGVQVVPVEVGRDSSSGDEGIIFLLGVEVGANAYNWSIWQWMLVALRFTSSVDLTICLNQKVEGDCAGEAPVKTGATAFATNVGHHDLAPCAWRKPLKQV